MEFWCVTRLNVAHNLTAVWAHWLHVDLSAMTADHAVKRWSKITVQTWWETAAIIVLVKMIIILQGFSLTNVGRLIQLCGSDQPSSSHRTEDFLNFTGRLAYSSTAPTWVWHSDHSIDVKATLPLCIYHITFIYLSDTGNVNQSAICLCWCCQGALGQTRSVSADQSQSVAIVTVKLPKSFTHWPESRAG